MTRVDYYYFFFLIKNVGYVSWDICYAHTIAIIELSTSSIHELCFYFRYTWYFECIFTHVYDKARSAAFSVQRMRCCQNSKHISSVMSEHQCFSNHSLCSRKLIAEAVCILLGYNDSFVRFISGNATREPKARYLLLFFRVVVSFWQK